MSSVAAQAPKVERRQTPFRRRKLISYAFIAPFMLIFVVFQLIPVGYALWQSVHATSRSGLGIGAVILDQIIPGAGRVAPIAGALISRKYSRNEEYAADRHGVELLERMGRSKDVMINTLTWLMDSQGAAGGSGGFFSTHPATGDRIDELRRL